MLSVSHIFCWTRGVRALAMPIRAPKGRNSKAQANGLGPRKRPFLAVSPERAECCHEVHPGGCGSIAGGLSRPFRARKRQDELFTQAVGLGFGIPPLRGLKECTPRVQPKIWAKISPLRGQGRKSF
jgi:hypothetical protein